jgi:pseudouridine synthase
MAGVASRRRAEALIAEGHILVNGRVADKLGTTVVPGKDVVVMDGRVVPSPVGRKLVYLAYHKPRGILVTASDPEGRTTIYDHIRDLPPGVIPVGRLDRNSEGLLLLTNDGELAHRLMHPRYEVIKEYEVIVEGLLTDDDIRQIQEGMDIGDGEGRATAPAEAGILEQNSGRTRMRIVLSEGRKRQVRRMIEALGYSVKRLIRVREGIITLAGLRLGTTRKLTPSEVKQLRTEVGLIRK